MNDYTDTQIQSILTLLDQLEVRGRNNMKAVVMIEQILMNPQKGAEKDGNCSKEE